MRANLKTMWVDLKHSQEQVCTPDIVAFIQYTYIVHMSSTWFSMLSENITWNESIEKNGMCVCLLAVKILAYCIYMYMWKIVHMYFVFSVVREEHRLRQHSAPLVLAPRAWTITTRSLTRVNNVIMIMCKGLLPSAPLSPSLPADTKTAGGESEDVHNIQFFPIHAHTR